MKQTENMGYVIFLSCVAALGGFLFGYDTAVISGTISMVAHQFGLDTIQTGWYVGCALIGSIIGVAGAGMISDTFGRKKAMVLAAILFLVCAIGCAFAPSFSWLVVYRVIGGIGIGISSIVSPIYISEVAMPKHRGQLVSFYQLAITIGFVGAYLANFGLLKLAPQMATSSSELITNIFSTEVWRGMLGLGAVPAIIFFIVIFFIPESSRWLIIKERYSEAEKVMTRILGSLDHAKSEIETIKLTGGKSSKSDWRLLFKPPFLMALIWGVCIAILGQFMGVNAVLYYGPTIFEQSGLSSSDSLFYQVLIGAVNMLTTILAMFIIDKVGRKKLVYFGVTGMIISLISIAGYFAFGEQLGISSIILLILFLLYIFFTAISISAVVWVILSEMYPTKVRGLAMSIAGFALWIGTYLIGQLTPWLLQTITPSGTFILFAFMCLPYIWIMRNKIPETAQRSLEEIEQYWVSKSKDKK